MCPINDAQRPDNIIPSSHQLIKEHKRILPKTPYELSIRDAELNH